MSRSRSLGLMASGTASASRAVFMPQLRPRLRSLCQWPAGTELQSLHKAAVRLQLLAILLVHSLQSPLMLAHQQGRLAGRPVHASPSNPGARRQLQAPSTDALLPQGCTCDYSSGPGTWVPVRPSPPGSNLSGLHHLQWATLDAGCPLQDRLQLMAATFTGAIQPLFPSDNSSTTAALPWEHGVEAAAAAASAAEAQAIEAATSGGSNSSNSSSSSSRGAMEAAQRRKLQAAPAGARLPAGRADPPGPGAAGNAMPGSPSHPRQLNMLIFSDSVGERTMRAWCRYVQNSSDPRVSQVDYHFPFDQPARKSLRHCRTAAGLSVWHFFNIGVDRLGPWFEDADGNWEQRLELLQEVLRQRLGVAPDIVVVSSAMWDVARLQWMDNWWWNAHGRPLDRVDHTYSQSYPLLEPQVLQAYSNDMARLMAALGRAFPQALLMTYTTAVLRHDKDGMALAKPLGRAVYVSQLNAALRQLAQQRGVPLVDFERMSISLGFDQYLSDNTHPNDVFMLQALNVMLNVYEQRRRCWALATWAPGKSAAKAADASAL